MYGMNIIINGRNVEANDKFGSGYSMYYDDF